MEGVDINGVAAIITSSKGRVLLELRRHTARSDGLRLGKDLKMPHSGGEL